MTRWAVVKGRRQSEIEAYLPDNYKVVADHTADPEGGINFVIEGEDIAGWTLGDYVIPRLASGNFWAKEYPSKHDAKDAACAAMN